MVLKRHLADLDPIALDGRMPGDRTGILLTPLAAPQPPPAADPSGGAIASVAVLGLLCTALALVLLAVLIDEAGPGGRLVIAYVNPVIAVCARGDLPRRGTRRGGDLRPRRRSSSAPGWRLAAPRRPRSSRTRWRSAAPLGAGREGPLAPESD